MEQEERRALEAYYESLTPDERRSRIVLKPEFRDAYNELVEADRQFPVPQYLWEKWVPVLGLFPVGVYLELRRMCFVNRATGERRDWCWPRQATLAKRLGVRKRQTVGEALRVLEANGFIKREPNYRRRASDGAVERGADRYLVYFEVPLIPEDATELLVRQMAAVVSDGDGCETIGTPEVPKEVTNSRRSEKRTYGAEREEKLFGMSEKRTYTAVRKTDSRNVTRTMTNNVPNVEKFEGTKRLREGTYEALALEVGESLSTWAGEWSGKRHASEGFHRRVARLMPEHLVREALTATRDAVDRSRAGKGDLARGPAAYFAGVVKNLAAENQIDLGLHRRDEPSPSMATARPKRPVVKRSSEAGPQPIDNAPVGPEEAKALLKGLLEKLQAKAE